MVPNAGSGEDALWRNIEGLMRQRVKVNIAVIGGEHRAKPETSRSAAPPPLFCSLASICYADPLSFV